MIAPPLTAERLLEGLSAKSDFRDGIIGDLAEEYAERVEIDGVAAARRWYHREALRAAPHLLLDWARSLSLREVRRLVNVVVAAYFLVSVLFGFLVIILQSILQSLGIATGILAFVPRSATPAVGVMLAATTALLAGYFAASLDKKTPVVSAILLGILWAMPSMVLSIILDTGEPVYRPVVAIIMIVAATVGGILQVRSARFNKGEDSLGKPVTS